MFNLKNSCFFDIDMSVENKYLFNDNIYKLIFEFCNAADLCQISSCSKKFRDIIAKELDYKYITSFEEFYCSSYNNYE
jgi:hypothetical protein